MDGLAVILFAARNGGPAKDDEKNKETQESENEGTNYLLKAIEDSIKEGKLGLEFIDKYTPCKKILFSSRPIQYFKNLNLKIFKSPNQMVDV